ncbi:outer membrane protein [Brevundimonas aveniformis]|uniref:outer membrane protein n=1 Tax=Brevundimonas aveniformis TaxID=370977 RepID=UPI0024932067|nr:outer membrane beta-barrel protein [Brevundimonas aveniformis]
MIKFIAPSAVLALVAMAGGAQAQEVSWAGPYAGANIDYSRANVESSGVGRIDWLNETPAFRSDVFSAWSADLEGESFGGGLFAGYRRQFSSGFVVGGEVRYDYLSLDDSRMTPQRAPHPASPGVTYAFGNSYEVQQSVSANLQLGFAMDDFLGYAIVGYTTGDVSGTAEVLGANGYSKFGEGSDWVSGYNFGFGGAYRVSDRMSVTAEFVHTELDSLDFTTDYRPGSTFAPPAFDYAEDFSVEPNYNTLRVGVAFQF